MILKIVISASTRYQITVSGYKVTNNESTGTFQQVFLKMNYSKLNFMHENRKYDSQLCSSSEETKIVSIYVKSMTCLEYFKRISSYCFRPHGGKKRVDVNF